MDSKIKLSELVSAGSGAGARNPARIRSKIRSRLEFSACCKTFRPTSAKRFKRQRHSRPAAVPHPHRINDRAGESQAIKQTKGPAHQPAGRSVNPWVQDDVAPDWKHDPCATLCR